MFLLNNSLLPFQLFNHAAMNQNFTARQFNNLSRFHKFALLEDPGVFLELNRIEGNYQIALFQLHNFYVELWLDMVNDKLEKAVAFSSYKRLDLFINEIDISCLYSSF